LAHLKQATTWDPISPPFLCTQAQVQDQLGQFGEALKTLDRAEGAVADDPHIPYVRAIILLRHGRNEEAKAVVNRALEIQPGFQPMVELKQRMAGRE
jgi:Flp pilus assembly protein TadD